MVEIQIFSLNDQYLNISLSQNFHYFYPTIFPVISLNQFMQVRAFKLPPLPGKKAPPVQIMKRLNRLFQEDIRTPSSGARKGNQKQDNKQNVRNSTNKRPSSVRSVSRQSRSIRQSSEDISNPNEKSVELIKDRINHNVKARVSMPSVSAKSWAIYQLKQAKLIYGKRVFKSREIASLTKIMNLITIIQIIDEYKLAPAKIRFKVSRQASCMIGTTAELKQNYQLSLYDLYFGMMLPSGNDAAQQIAQIGGSLIHMFKHEGQIKKEIVYNSNLFTEYYLKQNLAVTIFLGQMNRVSKRLQMQNSHFANPHGLSNPDNYSCAEDLCKLSTFCMENQVFRNVVKTQFYTAEYKYENYVIKETFDQNADEKTEILVLETIKSNLKWQNTNKLLREGWSGIKTGITPNAGPCLAASVEKFLNGRNLQFLVILIDSLSMEARWKEAKEIVEWVIAQRIYF